MSKLHEQRASVFSQMEQLVTAAGERTWSADEQTKYAALETEFRSLSNQIEAEARFAAMSKPVGPTVVTSGPADSEERAVAHSEAFRVYLARGEGALTPEQRSLLLGSESRTMSTTTGSEGGYTVPETVRNTLIETLKAYGGVRAVAEVITTDNGQNINLPGNDDTGNVGEIIAQNAEVGDEDFDFTNVVLGAHIFSSKAVRIPRALLEDNGVNLEPYVGRKLGERIGRKQSTEFLNGAGGGSAPVGLISGRDTGLDLNTTAAFDYDDLVDLTRKVNVAYRQLPGTGWLMNDVTAAACLKLVDGDGRLIFAPSMQLGTPDRLMGYAVTIDNGMDDDTAGGQPIAFGNFKEGYVVRDVRAVEIMRLAELYARFHQVGFIGFLRSDAAPKNTKAYAVIDRTA
jgi:HK97 family phage major capsid protein